MKNIQYYRAEKYADDQYKEGKHVYNKVVLEDGEETVALVIE